MKWILIQPFGSGVEAYQWCRELDGGNYAEGITFSAGVTIKRKLDDKEVYALEECIVGV